MRNCSMPDCATRAHGVAQMDDKCAKGRAACVLQMHKDMSNEKKPQAESNEKVTKKLTLERKVVQGGVAVKTNVKAGLRPAGEWEDMSCITKNP